MALVSVVLPVYNGMPYLKEAVDSILFQEFADFELVIVNDGSTDDTAHYLQTLTDKRIKIFSHESNRGLIPALNTGLQASSGVYVARMDHDDIALPKRLGTQVDYMEAHPEVSICGTSVNIMGSSECKYPPPTDEEIRVALLFNSPFYHPTVMIRRSVLQEYGIQYRDENNYGEDYGLWVDLAPYGQMHNLSMIGLLYRKHASQYTKTFQILMFQSVMKSRSRYFERLGVILSKHEEEVLALLIALRIEWNSEKYMEAFGLLKKLQHGLKNSTLNKAILENYFYKIWRRNLVERQRHGINSYSLFLKHRSAFRLSEVKTHGWFVMQRLRNLVKWKFVK